MRPDQPDTVQALHTDELRQRSIEIFPAAYVTLLSIVQGIAFGRLADAVFKTFDKRKFQFSQEYFQLALECFLVLAAIIVVFYMYVWYVLMLRWTPTVMDTLIPFFLGCFEVGLIGSIGQPRSWILWAGLLQFAGALAFLHSVLRTSEAMFTKLEDYLRIRGLLKQLTWVAAVSGVITCSVYGIAHVHDATKTSVWWASGEMMLMVVVMVARSEIVLSSIFRDHGFRWLKKLEQDQADDASTPSSVSAGRVDNGEHKTQQDQAFDDPQQV